MSGLIFSILSNPSLIFLHTASTSNLSKKYFELDVQDILLHVIHRL